MDFLRGFTDKDRRQTVPCSRSCLSNHGSSSLMSNSSSTIVSVNILPVIVSHTPARPFPASLFRPHRRDTKVKRCRTGQSKILRAAMRTPAAGTGVRPSPDGRTVSAAGTLLCSGHVSAPGFQNKSNAGGTQLMSSWH